MLLGESDDWTDPAPCKKLATLHEIEHTSYANAHHGFDSAAQVRPVKSIISRMTGKPVHAGGEPSARAASQAAMIAFFQRAFNQ
jgi:dienelactone hydrolase